jgi:uncharacterized membrane protein
MAVTKKKVERLLPKIIRMLRARIKLVVSAAVFAAVAWLLPSEWQLVTRILVGWDAGVVFYLCILGWAIAQAEVAHIRMHAELENDGRIATLALTVAATLASIAAIIVLLGQGKEEDTLQLLFAVATVLLSWAFVHSIFAVHYAHEFYGKGTSAGGLKFPGGDATPDYSDFFYFSFVIGMTFQVSDVQVTDRSIRRAVLAHGIVAFLFNVALLAIIINVAGSSISK